MTGKDNDAVRFERRDDEKRDKLEMVLDRVFRPGRWMSRACYRLGLQSARPIVIDRRDIAISRGNKPPLKIAFATDFHAGATTDVRVLRAACDALDELEPDILLLGGDFVSTRANDIHALAPLLANVRAPLGKFGVFGNHDVRADWPVIQSALREAGVQILANETVCLPPPHDDVSLIGFEDPILSNPDGSILDDVSGIRVLLMHAPDGLLAAQERHFDVALCGHTHGGQLVLPGGLIPYLPHGELSRTYPRGWYAVGNGRPRQLVVSRGVGCSTLPMRMCCDAEVHLVVLGGTATTDPSLAARDESVVSLAGGS